MKRNILKKLLSKVSSMLLAGAITLSSLPVNALAVEATSDFIPGTYTGSAHGYKGEVEVSLDLSEKDGQIVIDNISANHKKETDSFWQKVIDAKLLERIKENNGTEGIDTVAGATASSKALIEAVNKAIEKANKIEKLAEPTKEVDVSTIFDGGSGTKEDPYKITSKETFLNFADSVGKEEKGGNGQVISYKDLYISLETDLDFSDHGDWEPIGTSTNGFFGNFNGNNHSITGLKIGSKESPSQRSNMSDGLFALISNGSYIHDLNLQVDFYIVSRVSHYIGGLCGRITEGKIDNVDVSGTIEAETSNNRANIFVGGLAGNGLRQEIYNSSANVNLKSVCQGGIAQAGGIIGIANRGVIANCHTRGHISGSTNRDLEGMTSYGGVAGVNGGTIVNCYSNMDIVSYTYTKYVGALVGWLTGVGEIYQSYYDPTSEMIIDAGNKDENIISPSIPIGTAVGPGINEDNEPYPGSISIGVSGAEPQEAVNKLNNNLEKLYVDLEKGGRQEGHWKPISKDIQLNKWTLSQEEPSPVDLSQETVSPVYDPSVEQAIQALVPSLYDGLYPGIFYGRSQDGSLILEAKIGQDHKLTGINVISGNADKDILDQIVSGQVDHEGLEDGPIKEAMDKVVEKSRKFDYTGYGPADTNAIFESGSGSKEDPFLIKTEDQLRAFGASVNEDESYEGKYIRLDSDISLSGEWMPIGSGGKWPFKGSFDGDNHTISNMTIGSEDSPYRARYAGLFTFVSGGQVKDLYLDNYSIDILGEGKNRAFAGSIVTHVNNGSKIDNVGASGKLKIATDSAIAYAGGLFAQTDRSTITNSNSKVVLDAKSGSKNIYAGAKVGLNNRSAILNSTAEGKIKAEGSLNRAGLGGLAGMNAGLMANNYANVDLESINPTGDIGYLDGRTTGIGFTYNSYYNHQAKHRVAGKELSQDEKEVSGTIAKSRTSVKGEVADNEPASPEQALEKLNSNLGKKEFTDRVNTTMANWDESFNFESLDMQSWTLDEGDLVHVETMEDDQGQVTNPGNDDQGQVTKPADDDQSSSKPSRPGTSKKPRPVDDSKTTDTTAKDKIAGDKQDSDIQALQDKLANIEINRTAGEDRYETAVKISQKMYDSADTIIVATGSNFPDSLAASVVANIEQAPLLLTAEDKEDQIIDEAKRLGASNVIIIGGTNSVSPAEEVKYSQIGNVDRIAGENRYDTALKIAERVLEENPDQDTIIVADGSNYPDALSIAPYSAKAKMPIILADKDKLPGGDRIINKYGLKKAIIVGGENSVGNLDYLFDSTERISGENRYETSVKIAESLFDESNSFAIASGENFPDALSVSPLAAKEDMPLILTPASYRQDDVIGYIMNNDIESIGIYGGLNSVSPQLFQ